MGLGLGRQNSWQHVKDAKLCSYLPKVPHHHHHHLSLNHEGRWGTTNDFATSFLHFPLFSTALWDLANYGLVHSLMSSSHLFLCLPCFLPPFTVPCKTVLAKPDKQVTKPYHCNSSAYLCPYYCLSCIRSDHAPRILTYSSFRLSVLRR